METLLKPKVCKTCCYWTRNEREDYHYDPNALKKIGHCEMSDQGIDEKFFGAYGGGNYDSFYCGEDFGCINYKEKI